MITDPPFENVAAAPNSAHKSRFRLKWRCSSTFEGMRAQAHGNFEAPLPDDFSGDAGSAKRQLEMANRASNARALLRGAIPAVECGRDVLDHWVPEVGCRRVYRSFCVDEALRGQQDL